MRHLRVAYLGLIVGFILLVSRPSNTVAQTTETPNASTCTQILAMVQKNLSSDCGALGRDQVCYGNTAIKPEYQDAANAPTFAKAGDIAPVTALKSIAASPLNLQSGEWGVAVIKAQAGNLANTTAGNAVTFILYGDTNVTDLTPSDKNASTPAAPITCNATVTRLTRLRAAPNTNGDVIGQLDLGATLTVSERSADSAWVYGEVGGKSGWLFGGNLQLDCPVQKLPENNPNAPLKMPAVKAFYFSTGIGAQATCSDIPPSGLLIQSPTGRKINFTANGVDFTVGSSLILSAQPKGQMKVSIIEGDVSVKADGVTRRIKTGNELTVPMGGANGLQAVGAPSIPQAIPNEAESNSLFLKTVCQIGGAVGLSVPCEIVTPTPTPTKEIFYGGGAPLAPDTSTPTSTNPPPPPPGGGGNPPTSTSTVIFTPSVTLTPTFTPSPTPVVNYSNIVVNGNTYDVVGATQPVTITATITPAIAGIPITFTTSGGGTFVGGLTAVTVATDATGNATTPNFTRNAVPGPFSIILTSPAIPGSAGTTLSNMSGVPASIIVLNGSDDQITTAGTTFAIPLTVQVQGMPPGPVQGAPVSFDTTPGPAGVPGGFFGTVAPGTNAFLNFTDATGTVSTPFTTFAGLPGLIMPGPVATIATTTGGGVSVSFSSLTVN
ncbi:MAG: SH3 domain-containing protein [Chloroflexota bacterium]